MLDSSRTGIRFVNELDENERLNLFFYEYLYNGGGVAVGDINNDGMPDMYFVSNLGADALYLNQGGVRFEDISTKAGIATARGYKTGVTMVDVNGDGWLDIHVCRSGVSDPELRRNLLYINNGDLTFTERAAEYGLDDASYSSQAYFFDMDLDGDLDLYLLNHPAEMSKANMLRVTRNPKGELMVATSDDLTNYSDRLYRNTGGRFTDVTERSGILNEAFGLSAMIGDFNNDLLPDIYVCNDYSRPDFLYIANRDGSYTERFEEHFRHSALSSMGSDRADINNDGYPDLLTLDMVPADRYRYQMLSSEQNFDRFERAMTVGLGAQLSTNTLQLSHGNGQYSDIAFLSNTAYTDWSWSVLLADLDNDGWKDILVTNSLKRDLTNNDFRYYVRDSLYKEVQMGRSTVTALLNAIPSVALRSPLFRNERDLTFSDVTEEWNSGPPGFNNGAAYADLDGDGWLDLVINNLNSPATVLRNTGASTGTNQYVRFILADTSGKNVYGSEVELTTSTGTQVQQLQPARGFLSSSEPILHFGIPEGTTLSRARVKWPNGTVLDLPSPTLDATHRVMKEPGLVRPSTTPKPTLLVDRSALLPQTFAHVENPFIDFKREPLLHHKLSEDGPGVAVADVDNDGSEDVFLGGAMDQPGRLFLQQRDGRFLERSIPAFVADALHEDVAALFLDADGDGDMDLYAGSGGNERSLDDPAYQDRLYLNDGRGGFQRANNALPVMLISTGCVASWDMDDDGDPDLFVGQRSTPGRYPETPRSIMLRNEGGRFTDATADWLLGSDRIGMVTDARFIDLDGDQVQELVLVGEWMPVTIFKKRNGKLENVTADWGLEQTHGWWNALDAADLDGDGLPELIVGNAGLNTVHKAHKENPATMIHKDFDGNGTVDPILCRTYNGAIYPVHTLDRMRDQMVMLRKRFQRYQPYAAARLSDVLTADELRGAQELKATTMAHTLFLNRGGKWLEARELPKIAQLSAARAMRFGDVDGDGHMDLIVAGNHYGTDPQFGRSDACIGVLLRGDGKGGLEPLSATKSGLSIPGNVRTVVPIQGANRAHWLVVRNNGRAGLFTTAPVSD
ncbi:MAG: VCBS repeat-containing protein [Flavobacteriales bacterium]|nr:VCBS repeat-containing protein [Flavobacteriales bacterium]